MELLNTVSQLILGLLLVYVMYRFIRSIRFVPTQEAYVIERLGNYTKTLEPGFHALIPFIDRVAYKQDLREQAIEVEPQECFTKDNVKVHVDGVIYLSVQDAVNASYGITDYRFAAIQLAQTTTRSVIGQMQLDTTFQERARISREVVEEMMALEETWGIKVHRYEIKGIETPRTVQNAMERQMTAERERRAVVARSEGVRDSRVQDAQGEKEEMINVSEGEMRRRINEAEGRAEEIRALAEATARSIEQVAAAINTQGGKEAVQLQLAERYLKNLSRLAQKKNQIILPTNLSRFDTVMEGLTLDDFQLVESDELPVRKRNGDPLAGE